jgi:hypothetical protein
VRAGADTPSTPSVPFQLIQNKIAIPALIDGNGPFTLAIDSGSETMTISQKVADACKMTVNTGTVEVSGTSGSYIPVAQASVGKLQIGAAEIDKPFCTIDTRPHAVDGFVGAPLFNFYTVQIDFGNSLVTCFAPNSYKPDPNDIAIPITLGLHRVPVIHGYVGSVPINLEIDTGSSFPCELNGSVVKANDLTDKYTHEGDIVSSSVSGPVTCGVYGVTDLAVETKPAGAPALPAGVVSPSATPPAQGQGVAVIKMPGTVPTIFYPAGAATTGDWDGRLGEPAFTGMVLTLDYTHAVMYLRPSQPSTAPSAPPTTSVSPPPTAAAPPASAPSPPAVASPPPGYVPPAQANPPAAPAAQQNPQ